MQPQLTARKLIAVAVLVLFVLGGLSVVLFGGTNDSTSNDATEKVDQASDQTVSTINGENETYGVNANMPYFLGVSPLLNGGLSSQQLDNVKELFFEYAIINQLKIKQVSFVEDSVVVTIPDRANNLPNSVATFDAIFDEKTTVKATLQFDGIYNVQLVLKDTSGKQIYDSGPITTILNV